MVEIVALPLFVMAWLLVIIVAAVALLLLLVLGFVVWYFWTLWRGMRRGRVRESERPRGR